MGNPLISIVIPSYNQAQYLEACITSIIQQSYPKIEIILMDGGSTDHSLSIIEKYANHFTYWQSQPDGGQTQAIHDGFARATGELLTWLNSDDILLPNALQAVARAYINYGKGDVFYGNHIQIDVSGMIIERYKHPPYWNYLAWLTMPYIAQPGTCFTQIIWEKVGGVDLNMHCAFDYDLWYRFMVAGADFVHVRAFVSGFRRHPESKGNRWLERYAQEHEQLRQRYKAQFGHPLMRKIARLFLVAIQTSNGNYLSTLTFRLLKHI